MEADERPHRAHARAGNHPRIAVSRWCFNCYLVDGDAGLFVVDAGLPSIAGDLHPLIRHKGSGLRIVTATHGHPDHVSGARALAERHNAQIVFPATTLTYLDSAKPRTPTVAKLLCTSPVVFGQPFGLSAAVGFVRASSTAGFGTPRGMLWPGPRPTGALHAANDCRRAEPDLSQRAHPELQRQAPRARRPTRRLL